MLYFRRKCKKLIKNSVAVILAAAMSFCLSLRANSTTVSSECDLSDIDVPLSVSVDAAPIGGTLEIKAKSAILLEPYTGQILYEMNADEVLPPASITKIMSLLLVMQAITEGRLSLEDTVSASEHASSMGGSQIWLEQGEGMTVDDLLKAAVIASANDATVALAEAVSGSEEGFVAEMNRKAESLGMNSTVFVNCTGLDADGHVTSAHDVAVMSAELIKYPLIKKYSTVWMDTLRDGKNELVNTNKLVRFYKGTTGLKTGTTSGAGYCLSATAERDGLSLVAVIMGGDTSPDRFEGAKKLLDFGFANYSFKKISADISGNEKVSVLKGTKKELAVIAEKSLEILLEKGASDEIKQEIKLDENITAPVKKGQKIGSVKVTLGDAHLGEIPLLAASDIKRKTLSTAFWWMLSDLFRP